ncbi:6413_t:CDS:2 [Entrophospora sp. SA101]|nr:6104_t:CDS:2 [Entrophospora sp. SA101]CAJ0641911.1 15913_t:CDS:2 [Entrophospora sp. SA101]CAJ0756081.1 6413_t:CDS:2 [Entrophospora sp. SA101]CAJ0823491.1 1124_t:CDS:2 [Entrophospora sp. SA101]CAJ0844915.1 22301_t:CDS:2 [Entrophospora sp. SA101]
MAPEMISIEDDPVRLKKFIQDLCNQLAINRDHTKNLEQKLEILRNRTQELENPILCQNFKGTELERQNAFLTFENQQLNEENSELSLIIKEYENTLQIIMNKFRSQSYEVQQNKLELKQHYESLLNEEKSQKEQIISENVSLQTHISTISSLVRQAYDAQSDLENDILLESLIIENQGLRQMLSIAEGIGLQKEENNNNTLIERNKS